MDQLTEQEWSTIRRALSYNYMHLKKSLKRARSTVRLSAKPGELAAELADLEMVYDRIKALDQPIGS